MGRKKGHGKGRRGKRGGSKEKKAEKSAKYFARKAEIRERLKKEAELAAGASATAGTCGLAEDAQSSALPATADVTEAKGSSTARDEGETVLLEGGETISVPVLS